MIEIGKKYGKLTCIETYGSTSLFKCDCEKEVILNTYNVINHRRHSCGCDEKPGCYGSRLYVIWANMKRRCNDKNEKNYGAKGITICEEWKKYEGFRNWSLDNGYDDKFTLDRIDGNGNYEPSNCRWCSISTQNRNTKRSKLYEAYGEKKTIADWAEIFGFNYDTLRGRIRLGWDMQTALDRPVSPSNNQYSWGKVDENI